MAMATTSTKGRLSPPLKSPPITELAVTWSNDAWDQQIELLNQEGVAVQQSTLRFLRAQMSAFVMEVSSLWEEVAGMCDKHAELRRMVCEPPIAPSVDRDASARPSCLLGRLESCEQTLRDLPGGRLAQRLEDVDERMSRAFATVAEEVEALKVAHASHEAMMCQHCDHAQALLRDSGEKHRRREVDELRTFQAGRVMDVEGSGLQHRVDYLENMLGAVADKHGKDVECLQVVCAHQRGELSELRTAVQAHADAYAKMPSVEKRMKLLEDVINSATEQLRTEKLDTPEPAPEKKLDTPEPALERRGAHHVGTSHDRRRRLQDTAAAECDIAA